MAKGDSKKAQQMINTQGPLAQNYLTQQQTANTQLMGQFQNQMFGPASKQDYVNAKPVPEIDQMVQQFVKENNLKASQSDHSSLQKVAEFLQSKGIDAKLDSDDRGMIAGLRINGSPYKLVGGNDNWIGVKTYPEAEPDQFDGSGGAAGQAQSDYKNIMGQYGDFAKTGGYSDQDLSNIRARAVSPIRSIYSSASNALERQKALQGGYSPNYTAATAKMAREQSQGASDAMTNTEAAIAQMKQQGRLAGMGGMAGMFGSTPGMANMYGNQLLSSAGQGMQASGLQNQLGLGMIGAQINKAGVPSNYQQALGNVGGTMKIVGGAVAPWL